MKDQNVYSAVELSRAAEKIFGTRQECAAAALKAAGIKAATKEEAEKVIRNFLNKEVI